VIFDATALETQRGEAIGVFTHAPARKKHSALVGKLRCGHAVQKIGEPVHGELFRRADATAN
jgi:hypothetical protein